MTTTSTANKKGLLLAAIPSKNRPPTLLLDQTDKLIQDGVARGLADCIELAEMKGALGESKVFTNLSADLKRVCIIGMGDLSPQLTDYDNEDYNDGVDELKERSRIAVTEGLKSLSSYGAKCITIVGEGIDLVSAGESVSLNQYKFNFYKAKKDEDDAESKQAVESPTYAVYPHTESNLRAFEAGLALGKCQNLARELMEHPSNILTPSAFVERALTELSQAHPNHFEIKVYDKSWAEEKKMGAFLAVAQGSDVPLKFMEIIFRPQASSEASGTTFESPVVLVGKGICFDAGGVSLKPSAGMGDMKADMGGAACVVGTMKGLAMSNASVHAVGIIPLCENVISGRAYKPGDIIKSMNGTYIEVDNTDAEGRLILADALSYAQEAYPKSKMIMSIATLTGAITIALGSAAAGVFTKSNKVWAQLDQSGYTAGERFWRMPTYSHYSRQVKSLVADLTNSAPGREAGSCTANAFLSHFVKHKHYVHLDMAGIMDQSQAGLGFASSYLSKGMHGRPVRALIDFVQKVGTSL